MLTAPVVNAVAARAAAGVASAATRAPAAIALRTDIAEFSIFAVPLPRQRKRGGIVPIGKPGEKTEAVRRAGARLQLRNRDDQPCVCRRIVSRWVLYAPLSYWGALSS